MRGLNLPTGAASETPPNAVDTRHVRAIGAVVSGGQADGVMLHPAPLVSMTRDGKDRIKPWHTLILDIT